MRSGPAAGFLLMFFVSSCAADLQQETASPQVDTLEYAALVEDGREIAQTNCASCHAIGIQGVNANRRAPLFRNLLGRYNADILEMELAEGIRIAHTPMPSFQFKPEAAGALVAYLRSIQTTDAGQALVETRCAQCHAVGRTGTSPYPGAQSFRNLGRRWSRSQLRDALLTGIIVEHDKAEARVPPMKLTSAEIDAFLKYLDRIATKENPAPPSR